VNDFIDIGAKIDRILDSQDKGIRGPEQTLANLKSLLATLEEPDRRKSLDYLFSVLVRHIRRPSPTDPNALNKQRIWINTLFRVLFQSGRVDTVLCKIFAYIDIDNADVVNNWSNCIFQEITSAVYAYSNEISQNALATLKANAALFSHPGSDLSRAMPGLSPHITQLTRAIESAEFSRFEQQLRSASQSSPSPQAIENAGASVGLNSPVTEAMAEAAKYLRSDGPFNPKKAADLMRTSIDESHREIVSQLVILTGTQCVDASKDGARRAYLRKVTFISEPEEKFFSAIYTLLSEEASHKLIAPRETMLVMEQAVLGYLSLLSRRLPEFIAQQNKANP
jgi:hypothetical protein